MSARAAVRSASWHRPLRRGRILEPPHLARPNFPLFPVSWLFCGDSLGLLHVHSGSLALVSGADAACNVPAKVLLVRTDTTKAVGQFARARVSQERWVALRTSGGLVEATGLMLLGVLGPLWLRVSRGSLTLALPCVGRRPAAARHEPVAVPGR